MRALNIFEIIDESPREHCAEHAIERLDRILAKRRELRAAECRLEAVSEDVQRLQREFDELVNS